MTVKVAWVQKKRGDNHLPKFRPTDSDALDKAERNIYKSVLQAIDEIPESFYRRYIYNEVNPDRAIEGLIERLLPTQEDISVAIFAVYVQGANDMAHRIRESINKELRRLKSNARLQGTHETTKAIDWLGWEPFVFDPTIPAVDLFNQQPDNMAGRCASQHRSSHSGGLHRPTKLHNRQNRNRTHTRANSTFPLWGTSGNIPNTNHRRRLRSASRSVHEWLIPQMGNSGGSQHELIRSTLRASRNSSRGN